MQRNRALEDVSNFVTIIGALYRYWQTRVSVAYLYNEGTIAPYLAAAASSSLLVMCSHEVG